jgi:DNA-binding CsgD family transcriptional regulator
MGSLKPPVRPRISTLVSNRESTTRISQPPAAVAVATGFVLADLDFQLVYANRAGLQILGYPRELRGAIATPFVQKRMRSIFTVDRFTVHLQATRFLSGRRCYVCRPFLVESPDRPTMAALVLERHDPDQSPLADVGQRFRLSRRESETVHYLVLGLTTKEMAKRMGVSPNTVKQFVRLVMSKMRVTTRSGIVGRLVDRHE